MTGSLGSASRLRWGGVPEGRFYNGLPGPEGKVRENPQEPTSGAEAPRIFEILAGTSELVSFLLWGALVFRRPGKVEP